MRTCTATMAALLGPVVLLAGLCAAESDAKPRCSPVDVDAAIQKGVQFLWDRQTKDACWGTTETEKDLQTPSAAYGLLLSGVSPQEPRLNRAIEWMEKRPVDGMRARAWRVLAWALANRYTDCKYARLVDKEVEFMTHRLPFLAGRVNLDDLVWQSAVLLDDDVLITTEGIPRVAHQRLLEAWRSNQDGNGSWECDGWNPFALTAAGAWAMQAAFYEMHREDFVRLPGPRELPQAHLAERWIESNCRRLTASDVPADERVAGLFWLMRTRGFLREWTLGGEDLPHLAGRELLGLQTSDGGWPGRDRITTTAQALAVLSALRESVGITHLRYAGDWNNRPHAVGYLLRWLTARIY